MLSVFLKALFSSLLSFFFPQKTAQDQQLADLRATEQEAIEANETATKIHNMSDSELNNDLDVRMRD